jgi:polyphosphate kinase 2 (PPK2 family)
MAQKDKHQQLPREDQAPSGVAQLEAGAGPPPTMKRKEYERVSPAEQTRRLESRIDDKRRGRLNIISHLLSQVPYKPPAPRDITLPRRQPAHGYVQPDLPLRYIPAPF